MIYALNSKSNVILENRALLILISSLATLCPYLMVINTHSVGDQFPYMVHRLGTPLLLWNPSTIH